MADVIETLRGLVEKATKGPWECRLDGHMAFSRSTPSGLSCIFWNGCNKKGRTQQAGDDIRAAVAAVNALPALLDEIEALRKKNAALLAVAEAAEAYRTWIEPHGPVTESDRFCARKDGKALETALANLERHNG